MPEVERQKMWALHRYFLWADRMRAHLDWLLRNRIAKRRRGDDVDPTYIDELIYTCLWYGQLYVVAEGWRKLALADPVVDQVLASPNLDLLRRFRNGVFHFQAQYNDERFMALFRDGNAAVHWVRSLHKAFSDYFLWWTESANAKAGTGKADE